VPNHQSKKKKEHLKAMLTSQATLPTSFSFQHLKKGGSLEFGENM
jgi:hypothetical protein